MVGQTQGHWGHPDGQVTRGGAATARRAATLLEPRGT